MRRLFLSLLPVALAACSGSSDQATGGAGGGSPASSTSSAGSPSTGTAPGSTQATTGASGSATSASTGAGTGGLGPGDYCTNFDATENPIMEGGQWAQQGGLSGLDWTNVQTANGIAFGTLTGFGGYNDSIALLSGYADNQRVTAKIHFSGQRDDQTMTHEVELMLRGSYTPNVQHVYECNLGYSGAAGWYAQIVVLDGPIGTFSDITQGVGTVPDIQDGDVFKAEIIGNQIHTYVNDVEIATATNDVISSGQPGVGFFWRGTENVDDFAFDSFCASSL